MSLVSIPSAREHLPRMPYFVGQALSKIPFRFRPFLGSHYAKHRSEIKKFELMPLELRKNKVFNHLRNVVESAYTNVPFYRDYYYSLGFKPDQLRSFDDIARIPIVTKSTLREIDLYRRSAPSPGRYLCNTGGSTGAPLDFFITPRHIPNEWAHMHTIWGTLNYRQSSLKLAFIGRNLNDNPISYDALRHQITCNLYRPLTEIADSLSRWVYKVPIEFLHGYPSVIAEFADYCTLERPDLRDALRSTLKGALLGSEYPAAVYRTRISEAFQIPTISWYGHSERSILAGERETPYIYYPFQTYGYCEAVFDESDGTYRLVGTSYYNNASPFIRYDTGDVVSPLFEGNHWLNSFQITTGRYGDFVIDASGNRISLTALVFGRHHELFNAAEFVQIRQSAPGKITVLVTPRSSLHAKQDFSRMFDTSGVELQISFEILQEPIRTCMGKTPLLV